MIASASIRRLGSLALRVHARRRRARGRYDRRTRRLFQQAARLGDVEALLDYLLFRRDLGQPLQRRFVAPLCAGLDALPPARRWLAAALLTEIGALPSPRRRTIEPGPGLAIAAGHQPDWREGFRLALQAAGARGVCVVGNAGALAGTGQGAAIDGAGVVIRFNDFAQGDRYSADIGRRTSVWVTGPSYAGPRHDDVDWVVLSGPDMCFRLRNWQALAERLRRARPVLTVPLHVWRDLVRELQAPPSAGVLMLAWLRDLLGTWENVTAAGIGAGLARRYHLQGRRRGSARHHWAAEAALVQRWAAEGLSLLPTADAPAMTAELVESPS